MASFQSPCLFSAELDRPKPNSLITDDNAALSQEVFNISMAKIESIIKPDGITDDFW